VSSKMVSQGLFLYAFFLLVLPWCNGCFGML
jgi:hypothetical protein